MQKYGKYDKRKGNGGKRKEAENKEKDRIKRKIKRTKKSFLLNGRGFGVYQIAKYKPITPAYMH